MRDSSNLTSLIERTPSAVLVVVAGGEVGECVTRIGDEHAAFDRERRYVLRRGDAAYPPDEIIAKWVSGTSAAAVMLNADCRPVAVLDASRAVCEPWLEDAFLRACRDSV